MSVVGAPDQKTKVALKRVPVIAQGHVIEIAAIESGAVQKRETEILEAITQKKEDRYVKELLIIKESRELLEIMIKKKPDLRAVEISRYI